jgi:hypothetical protein
MCKIAKREVERDILAYLSQNPRAEDTVEGIVEWWLLDQRIRNETERAKEALSDLVSKGFVLERTGGDARSRYRINARRLKEIKKVLGAAERCPRANLSNKRNV